MTKISGVIAGSTVDLFAGFNPASLMPSTSILPHLVPKVGYSGMLEITTIKPQLMALAAKEGLMIPIVMLIFEYVITFDRWPGLPEHVDPTEDGAFFYPVMPQAGHAIATPAEREAFEDKLLRAEENLGGFYAFAELTLQPDPGAANRLAPLGKYAQYNETTGQWDLHENWTGIMDYTYAAGAPAGFPVVCKPSNGYLNPRCVDRSTFAASLLRQAAERAASNSADEGFTMTRSDVPVSGSDTGAPDYKPDDSFPV